MMSGVILVTFAGQPSAESLVSGIVGIVCFTFPTKRTVAMLGVTIAFEREFILRVASDARHFICGTFFEQINAALCGLVNILLNLFKKNFTELNVGILSHDLLRVVDGWTIPVTGYGVK